MGSNYYSQRHIYTDEQLVKCYLKHKSQIKAANELGVSRETVARAVRRAGIALTGRKPNGGDTNPQTKIKDVQLIECAKNMSCNEIAKKFNMSEERVYRRARKLGISLDTKWSGGNWKRRAYRYGCNVYDETITLRLLFSRDKGICKICGQPTDITDIKNGHIGKRYPTLDHIIPLSKGGTHTWDNVQLAHMACNAGKCDKEVIA